VGATYTVTRQSQWSNDGEYVVEISMGGIDYTNPDALVAKYPGEFETFTTGLLPAVEAAIEIAEAWKADEAKRKEPRKIFIGVGATGGYTMPFDGVSACKTNYKRLLREAKKHDAQLPRCPVCGEILSDKPGERYGNEFTINEEVGDDRYPFDREYCAEKDLADRMKPEDSEEE
jgi:hypothetical protein